MYKSTFLKICQAQLEFRLVATQMEQQIVHTDFPARKMLSAAQIWSSAVFFFA